MEKLNNNEMLDNIKRIIKGSIFAIIFTAILLLIFAIVLTYTNLEENTIKPIIIVITGISVLIGSSISTLTIKKNGMLNGGIVGLTYILIMLIISSITSKGLTFNVYSIMMILISILMGIIGGIIGVNLR